MYRESESTRARCARVYGGETTNAHSRTHMTGQPPREGKAERWGAGVGRKAEEDKVPRDFDAAAYRPAAAQRVDCFVSHSLGEWVLFITL